jgi:glycosyltransferase involved in cell wall biosynthesis
MSTATDSMVGRKHLIAEGWRFIPHSFAVVNQGQILALLRRGDIRLEIVESPYFSPQWKPQPGLVDKAEEEALKALPVVGADASADVTLRIAYPFDFSLSPSRMTAVFATAEGQVLRRASFCALPDLDRLIGNPRFRLVTPSNWSAQGFATLGFGPDQIRIVPHGVDLALFTPQAAAIETLRPSLGLNADDFVFLHVGAMTTNKGIDVLLKAFAATCTTFPQARLVLKGTEDVFASKDALLACLAGLSADERERVVAKARYMGQSLSRRALARLYQAADAYVSPYRCEGFNIPVLEAAACGIPVIVTRGGSTDDFVADAFARRIRSAVVMRDRSETAYLARVPGEAAAIATLEPDPDHLVAEMAAIIRNDAWRRAASLAAAAHVRAYYGWDQVADRLVDALWDETEERAARSVADFADNERPHS